jgi:hypothetical protein
MNFSSSTKQVPASNHASSPALRRTQIKQVKLRLLRDNDKTRSWSTLEDRRLCLLCGGEFSGSEVLIRVRNGKPAFHCPEKGCQGNLGHFVHPGNPLLNEAAWEDWMRPGQEEDSGDPECALG